MDRASPFQPRGIQLQGWSSKFSNSRSSRLFSGGVQEDVISRSSAATRSVSEVWTGRYSIGSFSDRSFSRLRESS